MWAKAASEDARIDDSTGRASTAIPEIARSRFVQEFLEARADSHPQQAAHLVRKIVAVPGLDGIDLLVQQAAELGIVTGPRGGVHILSTLVASGRSRSSN